MSVRNEQEPTVTPEDGPLGGERSTHPAFAQISASRVTGGASVLYGSDFVHGHCVRLRISESSLRRDLSTDWPFAKSIPYIEVDLSEAQWASFVSSLNVGSGVQCTLRYFNGQPVPAIARPVVRTEQFARESDEKMERAMQRLREVEDALDRSALGSKAKASLKSMVNAVRMDIGVNQDFVAERFSRHMEKTVEKAKTEVNVYVTNVVTTLGVKALQQAGYDPTDVQVLQLPDSQGD